VTLRPRMSAQMGSPFPIPNHNRFKCMLVLSGPRRGSQYVATVSFPACDRPAEAASCVRYAAFQRFKPPAHPHRCCEGRDAVR
jgi:hypothetical protein